MGIHVFSLEALKNNLCAGRLNGQISRQVMLVINMVKLFNYVIINIMQNTKTPLFIILHSV